MGVFCGQNFEREYINVFKTLMYSRSIKVEEMSDLTLMNDPRVQYDLLFLCFTDVTCVSEGHGQVIRTNFH